MESAEDYYNQVAFEMFAGAYPHEAYEMDKERFCDFVRSKNPNITNHEIYELLQEIAHYLNN